MMQLKSFNTFSHITLSTYKINNNHFWYFLSLDIRGIILSKQPTTRVLIRPPNYINSSQIQRMLCKPTIVILPIILKPKKEAVNPVSSHKFTGGGEEGGHLLPKRLFKSESLENVPDFGHTYFYLSPLAILFTTSTKFKVLLFEFLEQLPFLLFFYWLHLQK